MRILVLGASGLIGGAVLRACVAAGHECLGLVRNRERAAKLPTAAKPVIGDITEARWLSELGPIDAVIHAAAAFGPDMAAADAALSQALIAWATTQNAKPALILTGGCWLYPPRIEPPLAEGDDFEPLPPFRWMVEHRARLCATGRFRVSMVHPAIVWNETAGPAAEFAAALSTGAAVEIVGDPTTRWPMVHSDELADLYLRAATDDGAHGDFHGVAEASVPVIDILLSVADRIGRPPRWRSVAVADAVARRGAWVAGQARSQAMIAPRSWRLLGWRGARRIV